MYIIIVVALLVFGFLYYKAFKKKPEAPKKQYGPGAESPTPPQNPRSGPDPELPKIVN